MILTGRVVDASRAIVEIDAPWLRMARSVDRQYDSGFLENQFRYEMAFAFWRDVEWNPLTQGSRIVGEKDWRFRYRTVDGFEVRGVNAHVAAPLILSTDEAQSKARRDRPWVLVHDFCPLQGIGATADHGRFQMLGWTLGRIVADQKYRKIMDARGDGAVYYEMPQAQLYRMTQGRPTREEWEKLLRDQEALF